MELEQALQQERLKLGAIRKKHYDLERQKEVEESVEDANRETCRHLQLSFWSFRPILSLIELNRLILILLILNTLLLHHHSFDINLQDLRTYLLHYDVVKSFDCHLS